MRRALLLLPLLGCAEPADDEPSRRVPEDDPCSALDDRAYSLRDMYVTAPVSEATEATYYSNYVAVGSVLPDFRTYTFPVGYAGWGLVWNERREQAWGTVDEGENVDISAFFAGERVATGPLTVETQRANAAVLTWPRHPGAVAYGIQRSITDVGTGPHETFTDGALVSAAFAGTDAPGCANRFFHEGAEPTVSGPAMYYVTAIVR